MVAVDLPGEERAGLIRVAAHGDDSFDRLVQELREMFRGMALEIDPDFAHDGDGEWMHVTRRLAARAGHAETALRRRAQKAFGQMAAAGVTGAEDEDEGEGVIEIHGGGWG